MTPEKVLLALYFKNKNLRLKLACTIKKIAELSVKGSESDPRYSNYLLAIKLMIESRPLQ